MRRLIVLTGLLCASGAFANDCGLLGRPSLPAPNSVDPENEAQIFDFIGRVTPWPDRDKPGALEQTLNAFWTLYTPEVEASEIARRVRQNRPSRMGLQILTHRKREERYGEIGRLRLIWMNFLDDVAPDAKLVTAAARHRAQIMTVTRRAANVLEYLAASVSANVRRDDDSFPRLMRELYATYLPNTPVPNLDVRGDSSRERDQAMVRIWKAYVDASTMCHDIGKAAPKPNHPPFKLKFELDPTQDPSTVPQNARAMVEYLMLRYPHIAPKETRAIFRLVEALRSDYGLGPTRRDIAATAVKSIMVMGNRAAEMDMIAIWRELEHDRARAGN